jgi:peptide deformylase
MEIIPVHHNKSLEATSWAFIKDIAYEMRELANGEFAGEHKSAAALHHAQVSDTPYNFFVLSDSGIAALSKNTFPHWCIMNPRIIALDGFYRPLEGCMSWPHRKQKKVDRFFKAHVAFDYPGGKKEMVLDGLAAEIFQHEYDHGQGKTICD